MKVFIAIAALSLIVVGAFPVSAEAQSYNSQRARQDREYKSLSAATQRAFAPVQSSTSRSNRR